MMDDYMYSEELNLRYRGIIQIPKYIGYLTHLELLDLSSNQIKFIPKFISNLVNLVNLKLEGNQIKILNECISYLINLKTLNIAHNKLSKLPEVFNSLTNLTILDLSYNKFTHIPKCIGYLTNLKTLYLDNNKIKKVSDFIGLLVNLEHLYLDNNKITALPFCISRLLNLKTLQLPHNNITVFPNYITNLLNLNAIFLHNNQITQIPDTIGRLRRLEYLFLKNNRITNIPISITRCNYLQNLEYDGNPIENIAPQVIRFLDTRILNTANFQVYNDTQSVHNHSIQECIRISIENITAQSFGNINYDIVVSQILSDIILTQNTKELILEYVEYVEAHSVLLITFKELLGYVWNTILGMNVDVQKEVKQVMNSEMADAECKCFTGRLSRLVNCLNGFSPLVRVEIADNQQISNIIVLVKQRLEGEYTIETHKEIVKTEMTERGYDEAVITEWLEFID
jgi:Leucine-rich repeat (LRR) protein